MAQYRLYFFNCNGHVEAAANLECRDDEHARQSMLTHAKGYRLEIWQHKRMVARYEPPPENAGKTAA